MGIMAGGVSRDRVLHLWELAKDFGEGVPITRTKWVSRYPGLQKSPNSWQKFRYKGLRAPLGFKALDEEDAIVLYYGTALECAKILDNYVVRYERVKAEKVCKSQEHLDAVYAGLHRLVACPVCLAPEELSCERDDKIVVHVARVEAALESISERELLND